MNKTLNIIVIYTISLSNRSQYINSTLTYLKNLCEKNNITVNIVISNAPDSDSIIMDVDNYNKRVNYDKIENCLYNDYIFPLNPQQISNIEKQRNALFHVKENEYNLILEDDVIISKDYLENIELLFKNLNILDYTDFLLTSDFIHNNKDYIELIPFENYKNILLTKSSYFINKKTALQLYEFTDIFKYDFKTALTKFLNINKETINSRLLNKCVFLEGSKVGIFGSTVKNKNFLSQNAQYIELAKIVNSDFNNNDLENASVIYNVLEKFENPEIDHLYSLLHYKNKDIKTSKKFMLKSIENLKKNNNYYSKSNEIINNAINIYKYDQEFFDECVNNKSKYS